MWTASWLCVFGVVYESEFHSFVPDTPLVRITHNKDTMNSLKWLLRPSASTEVQIVHRWDRWRHTGSTIGAYVWFRVSAIVLLNCSPKTLDIIHRKTSFPAERCALLVSLPAIVFRCCKNHRRLHSNDFLRCYFPSYLRVYTWPPGLQLLCGFICKSLPNLYISHQFL